VLILSQMPPDRMLGIMVSLGVITSMLASFLLIPFLLSVFERKTNPGLTNAPTGTVKRP
jgi:predicted RND superfamily exporter protein